MKKTFVRFLGLSVIMILTTTGPAQSPSVGSVRQGPSGTSFIQVAGSAIIGSAAPAARSTVHSDLNFGKVPLYFIANEGQVEGSVDYYVQGSDMAIFFGAGGVAFTLNKPRDPLPPVGERPRHEGRITPAGRGAGTWGVRLDFVGADPLVRPKGGNKTEGVVSYFRGKPEDWKAGVATYSSVVYSGLWPGIDLAYSGTVNELKYEFVVAPGADPGRIRLAYRGASAVKIDDSGRLAVSTPYGGFEDGVPVAYQEIEGKRVPVLVSYALDEPDAAASMHAYHFRVGEYDHDRPLILDPVVFVYCGFIGGYSSDEAFDIAVDPSGSVYLTGYTWSNPDTFPVTVGPDLSRAVNYDAFVAKLNASGTALMYCGYIGGDGYDEGWGVAADASGNAYVAGFTTSPQATFPVLIGPDITHNGYDDVFVTKINPAGTGLVYSGYIGGNDQEWARDIALDSSGCAYVSGTTISTQATFPETVGPDLSHNGGLSDAFVAKVSAAGSGLVYCGYIGGSGQDKAYGIAVSGTGEACVAGTTRSSEATFPESIGPDLTHNGGDDAFVAKVSASGSALVYCGYIGGSGTDYGHDIAVDSAGNAYVVGETSSSDGTFPVAVGPDLTYNSHDGFITKVNASGSALVYSGYIGGSDWTGCTGVAVDAAGNAHVAGYTYADETAFPVRGGPDLTWNGDRDAFIAKVNPAGSGLVYCGYLGGAGEDYGYAVALDSAGSTYVTGYAYSTETDFPVYIGPDLTQNGSEDVFVAKITEEPLWKPRHAAGNFAGDAAAEAVFDLGVSGVWMYDPPGWSQLTPANPESLMAADVDGDAPSEILADLGFSGLWVWNGGIWDQLSGANVDCYAAGDTDGDGIDEVVCDFGSAGMWLYNGGAWQQLSGVNADYVATADLDASGGREIVGDFGAIGLWIWSAGTWTILSSVNADYVTFGNTDGLAGDELIGDFGATGLWSWGGGLWTQLSGVNADYMMAADIDDSGDDEIVGDFSATGLWLWDGGAWLVLSGVDAEFMIRGDIDVDAADEVLADFGALGLWLDDGGVWSQISGVNPEFLLSVELDFDFAEEILADFGALGIYKWDAGDWSQISPGNPE